MPDEEHRCSRERVLGEHDARLTHLETDYRGLQDTLNRFAETVNKSIRASINGDAALEKEFREIKVILTSNQKALEDQNKKLDRQSTEISEVNRKIDRLSTDVDQLKKNHEEHKSDAERWKEAIEHRLKRLEAIRYYIYASGVIIVGILAFVIYLGDATSAIEKFIHIKANSININQTK